MYLGGGWNGAVVRGTLVIVQVVVTWVVPFSSVLLWVLLIRET